MYGMDIPEGGPIPTSFQFQESPGFKLAGQVEALTKPAVKEDPFFNMTIGLHDNEAIFVQRVEVKEYPLQIEGYVEFMVCDDQNCLPPKDVDFSFSFAGDKELEETMQPVKTSPAEEDKGFLKKADEPVVIVEADTVITNQQDEEVETLADEPEATKEEAGKSTWIFFIISFLAGLAGILTPCVFPMIPMTVTFFMRGSGNRVKAITKGLIFGVSIVAIYTSVGVVVALTNVGADIGNQLSTSLVANLIFFVLFLVFAASFLGMFELVLPSGLVNKADQKADKGGYIGAFFMALTLVVVSFSCTGPIVGALLVESAGGLALKPIMGMFGFSLAFALPFTLFAIFPSWLKGLPKSGGWLNAVKVVMGLLVLAFGFKFLGNIDQTYRLGILNRDIYLAIWIVIFTIMGLYLVGKIKFAHDSDLPYVSVPRLFLAIASFTFALYLIPGMFGAPLKAISGLIPPKNTLSLDLSNTGVTIQNQGAIDQGEQAFCGDASYDDIFTLPYGLKGYYDYQEGMSCAVEQDKPLFLDFKGHACANCKEVEANIWSDPRVQELLREDFVITALYVDDRTKLPEDEWVESSFDNKLKKTIGKKWADFQITRFGTNTQPFYIILDHDGEIIAGPVGYEDDVEKYLEFLEKGKQQFSKYTE